MFKRARQNSVSIQNTYQGGSMRLIFCCVMVVLGSIGTVNQVAASQIHTLTPIASNRVCAPATLLKVVTSNDAPDLPPGHFGRAPKTLFRMGEKLGRVEETLNPQTGIHLLVIVNEPYLWMVDLAQHQGQQHIDPGPTYYFRAKLFGNGVESQFIRNLEFGCEVPWMQEIGAKAKQLTHPILGVVTEMVFADGQEKLILFARNGKPLRVEFFGPKGWISAIDYISFESDQKPDPKLFLKPEGIDFGLER